MIKRWEIESVLILDVIYATVAEKFNEDVL